MLTPVEYLDEKKQTNFHHERNRSTYHNWTFPQHCEHVRHVKLVYVLFVIDTTLRDNPVPRESFVLSMEHRD